MRTLLIAFLLPAIAFAQQDGTTGTVSGHVYCADTQQPARLARVVLISLPPAEASAASSKANTLKLMMPVETRLDGSFQVSRVPPGDYYISVTQPGYLSPELQFTDAELQRPTAEERKRIVQTVPTATVAPNMSATVSVVIHRGGAIAGVLRYDDGSPVSDVEVQPVRRDPAGGWTETPESRSGNLLLGTDDLGHFRIYGLAPGEYTLKVFCHAQGQKALTIYYGDGFFEKDAKPIKLGEGEESSGADIVIRLSILHTIAGSLLNSSGQVIHSGKVALYTISDNIEVASAILDPDNDASFHMDLVPEGHYILRVSEARDVDGHILRDSKDPNQIQDVKQTVLRTYGNYESPFVVVGDMTGVKLTIPQRPK